MILVTGVGLTTALGVGAEASWKALLAGESGLVTAGGRAPRLPDEPVDSHERAVAHVVRVGREALAQAGFADGRFEESAGAALVLGTTLAASAASPGYWATRTDLSLLRAYVPEPLLDRVARELGAGGETVLVSNACAAGASAVALAADLLRLGRARVAVAIGFDALDPYTLAGFAALKAVAAGSPRPFTVGRDGTRLADGFAALVLEREDGARLAGRRPLARLLGTGESSDAYHLTQPDPEGRGAALAMERALASAGIAAGSLDLVHAHATATPANDGAELAALGRVLGSRLASVPIAASKAALGHALGGAGAVSAVLSVLALRDQRLAPTLEVGEREPAAASLDLVPTAREAKVTTVLSNCFGFGGSNAALVLGRSAEGRPPEREAPAARGVVVTGLGVISPEATTEAELEARRASGGSGPAGFAWPFPVERFVDAATVRKLARLSELAQLAVVATGRALEAGALPASARESAGVFLGTCFGPAAYRLEHDAQVTRDPGLASPLKFAEGVSNAASGHAQRVHGLRGPGLAILGGEEAGLSAVVAARDRIAAGGAPAIVAGGVEEHAALLHAALVAQGLVPEEKPFAPGAAAVLLEDEAHARGRGARIRARVLGAGRSRGSLDAAVARALEDAGAKPGEVGLTLSAAEAPGEGFAYTSAVAVLTAVLALEPPRAGSLERVLVVARSRLGASVALLLGRAS